MNILVAVVPIIIIILFIWYNRYIEDKLLKGFWVGSPDFLQSAELKSFLLFISDKHLLSNKRYGYIVVINKEGIIINNPVELTFVNNSLKPGLCLQSKYHLHIKWLDTSGNPYEKFFPSHQIVYYYPEYGKLVFMSHNQVYAILFKDHLMGDITNMMPIESNSDKPIINDDGSEEI